MALCWRRLMLLGSLLLTTTGCSIAMALSGTPDPDFDAFQVGSTREQVEAQLGQPKYSDVQTDGGRKDTYEVEVGNSPNGGRATFNFYMDLATIGLWELPGTILEATMGEDEQVQVTYDAEGRVVAIDGYRPPVQSDAMKQAVERQKALETPSRRPVRIRPAGKQGSASSDEPTPE